MRIIQELKIADLIDSREDFLAMLTPETRARLDEYYAREGHLQEMFDRIKRASAKNQANALRAYGNKA